MTVMVHDNGGNRENDGNRDNDGNREKDGNLDNDNDYMFNNTITLSSKSFPHFHF